MHEICEMNILKNWLKVKAFHLKLIESQKNTKIIFQSRAEGYCFTDQTNYAGFDVGFIQGILTATDCQFECQKSETCLFFTYRLRKKLLLSLYWRSTGRFTYLDKLNLERLFGLRLSLRTQPPSKVLRAKVTKNNNPVT